jgi:hypothetical protein
MSVDWDRYAKPSQTRAAPNRTSRPPEEYGIASLSVGAARAVDGVAVAHTPKSENRAHADILGLSKEEFSELDVTIRREKLVECIVAFPFKPGDSMRDV